MLNQNYLTKNINRPTSENKLIDNNNYIHNPINFKDEYIINNNVNQNRCSSKQRK